MLPTVSVVDAVRCAVETQRVTIKMVKGPSVTVLSPVAGDSATPGAGLTVTLRATDPTGVLRLGFRLTSDASVPTKVDTTVIVVFATLPKDVTTTATIPIPTNSPAKGLLTITPISTNVGGQDGASAPTVIAIRAGLPPAPRVFQKIPPRVETADSVTITAIGNGVTFVGYVLRDSTGVLIKRDSVAIAQPYPSTAVVTIPLLLTPNLQGKRITLSSFAYDQGGRIDVATAIVSRGQRLIPVTVYVIQLQRLRSRGGVRDRSERSASNLFARLSGPVISVRVAGRL